MKFNNILLLSIFLICEILQAQSYHPKTTDVENNKSADKITEAETDILHFTEEAISYVKINIDVEEEISRVLVETKIDTSCNDLSNNNNFFNIFSQDTPIRLQLDGSIPAQYIDIFHSAANQWENQTGMDLFHLINPPFYFYEIIDTFNTNTPRTLSELSLLLSPFDNNTIYWLPSRYFTVSETQYSALTLFRTRSIFINREDFIDNTQVLESLVVHELGHILGLKDDYIPYSVMYGKGGPLFITSNSIESIKCNYGQ